MPINTLCVFGTRPEAIKMVPIIQQLQSNPQFNNKICVTGQHQQMLNSVLDLFQIIPDFNLNVMTQNQNLSQLTAKILAEMTGVFEQFKPDIVLVHGDTTTTLTASLSAYYHHVPVAHVEAGLRTNNLYSPWPEEANRKISGVLANLHFSPTESARKNLLREGVAEGTIYVTGNTVIDTLYNMVQVIDTQPQLLLRLQQQFSFLSPLRRVILVTGHRRESFGSGFQEICKALVNIARNYPDVDIVYPVHLNPQVQQPVKLLLSGINNLYLIDPVDYLPFVYLMKSAYLILTDSGGVQEEAPSLGKPVLVMRELTERPEAVDAGTVILVGTNAKKIVKQVSLLLNDTLLYKKMAMTKNPYGDGKAAGRIVQALSERFSMVTRASEEALVHSH